MNRLLALVAVVGAAVLAPIEVAPAEEPLRPDIVVLFGLSCCALALGMWVRSNQAHRAVPVRPRPATGRAPGRVLLVVSSEDPELADLLRRSFAHANQAPEIVLDRRSGDRRRRHMRPARDRRSGERRRLNLADRLRSPGWAVVRVAASAGGRFS